jgi:hypothetical protein
MSSKDILSEVFSKKNYDMIVDGLNINFPTLDSANTWQAGFNNAKKIYEAFGEKKFDLQYAFDEKIWVYLVFTEYWSYMKKRFPIDNENSSSRLANRYFFGKNPERRHELARLYWIPYLTAQDDGGLNKYELTEIAFEFADPSSAIIERNIGRNPKIVRSSLRAIKNNLEHKKIKNRSIFSSFAKRVNNFAGSVILDYYEEGELDKMFTDMLKYELEKD